MTEVEHWWLVYGPFRPGCGGLPHLGDVIKYYRKLRGYSVENFADMYEVTTRYLYMLESDDNVDKPQSSKRREMLATLLGAPLVLFGIGTKETEYLSTAVATVSDLESVIPVLWASYYTGDFQEATAALPLWLSKAENAMKSTTGIPHDQFKAALTRFLHLSATAERDKSNITLAQQRGSMALSLSVDLNNSTLMLASFHHLFRVHMQAEEWEQARNNIEAALLTIKHAPTIDPAMLGTIYVDAGEVYGQIGMLYDPGVRSKALKYLDEAAKIARSKKETILSCEYIKFSMARVMNERASVATHFGMKKDAENALNIAAKTMTSTNVRFTKDHLLSRANISLADGDVDNACKDIIQSIALHKETNSFSNYTWMVRQYRMGSVIEPSNPYLLRVGEKLQTFL
jgi:tetratricopeptide (TPR) repeat protein